MPAGPTTERRRSGPDRPCLSSHDPWKRVPTVFRLAREVPAVNYSLHYYDLVLAGVLASLLVGVAVGWFTSFPLAATVPVFALVAAGIIGHGLFVNGPVDGPGDLQDEVGVFD